MKILIFDYDGVLADSWQVHINLFKKICSKYNLPIPSTEEGFKDFFNENFFESASQNGISKKDIPKLVEFIKINLTKSYPKMKLFPNVKNLIDQLAQNNKIYIITSNITGLVKKLLKENNIHNIENILGADQGVSKVEKILSIKKQYPNSEIYYIGDTVGDIIEGKNAGVRTIATTWGFHDKKRLEKEKPDYVIDSISELIKIFI